MAIGFPCVEWVSANPISRFRDPENGSAAFVQFDPSIALISFLEGANLSFCKLGRDFLGFDCYIYLSKSSPTWSPLELRSASTLNLTFSTIGVMSHLVSFKFTLFTFSSIDDFMLLPNIGRRLFSLTKAPTRAIYICTMRFNVPWKPFMDVNPYCIMASLQEFSAPLEWARVVCVFPTWTTPFFGDIPGFEWSGRRLEFTGRWPVSWGQ